MGRIVSLLSSSHDRSLVNYQANSKGCKAVCARSVLRLLQGFLRVDPTCFEIS